MPIDKEKQKEIYPLNIRLDGNIEEHGYDEDGTLKISGFLHFDEKEFIPWEQNGEKGFFNKEKNLFIPNTELGQMAKSLIGAPILAPTPKIDNINEYYERQFKKLNKYFCNKPDYDFSTADKLLRKYNNSQSPFIFLLIDMVESTKRSIILDLKTNSIINNMFLNESAQIIRCFGGHIYKFEGDGLISFFTTDNILNRADDSIQCAYTLKTFIEKYLNNFLKEKNINPIEFRISINYGDIFVKDVGDKVELNGYNLNLTFKIQKFAGPNDIVIGSNLVDLAHKKWKQRMKKLNISSGTLSKITSDRKMKIYKLHNLEDRND